MFHEKVYEYLSNSILKSGEHLDTESAIIDNNLIECNLIKRTNRTLRIKGVVVISTFINEDGVEIPDSELLRLKLTPRKKVSLEKTNKQTFKWLEDGWIFKVVRFENDEKTVKSSHYQMGYNLFLFQQIKAREEVKHQSLKLIKLKQQMAKIAESIDCISKDKQRYDGLTNISRLFTQLKVEHLMEVNSQWSARKTREFLQFIVAITELSVRNDSFDWKEIGAIHFKEIGGSKQFDHYKKEFIEELEKWAQVSSYELGLVSLGQIVPIFFSGAISGHYADYKWGPLHALTDLLVSKEELSTSAKRLWLVENRAILTRFSAQPYFLEETMSLMISVDGHLRSAHKSTISQLLRNSEISEVIIWCDYDKDGLIISNEIYNLVSNTDLHSIKWILPNLEVRTSKSDYEEFVIPYIQTMPSEQEMTTGSVDVWRKWIQE
ncbi:hypothetical protein ACFO0S_04085 [Chryseomicrobium palamuruense]|uniref:Toprim domain-containing protein n=1 Tax=Chryseomicrobium palamuruense TaxID=682973 RepID=A0ABV8UU28_9BACL